MSLRGEYQGLADGVVDSAASDGKAAIATQASQRPPETPKDGKPAVLREAGAELVHFTITA